MPSNDEITAALVILAERYDRREDVGDLRAVCRAMLNTAELIRLDKLERELKQMSNPDEAS